MNKFTSYGKKVEKGKDNVWKKTVNFKNFSFWMIHLSTTDNENASLFVADIPL